MTARDADQTGSRRLNLVVTGASDVLESGPDGPRRRPPKIAAGSALVLMVVAAATGYLFGSRHPAATARPTPSTTPAVALPLAETDKQCSVQLTDRLQLGIEIINQSTTTMTLRLAQAVLPLGGLRATAAAWGGCGQLSPPANGEGYPLPAGATTWLTITFDVLVQCPGPLPVQFTVQYTQESRNSTADLPGFHDLGGVPYTKCPAGSS